MTVPAACHPVTKARAQNKLTSFFQSDKDCDTRKGCIHMSDDELSDTGSAAEPSDDAEEQHESPKKQPKNQTTCETPTKSTSSASKNETPRPELRICPQLGFPFSWEKFKQDYGDSALQMWNKAEIYDGDDGGGKVGNVSPSAAASPKRLIPHGLHAKISRILGFLNAARKVINNNIIFTYVNTNNNNNNNIF